MKERHSLTSNWRKIKYEYYWIVNILAHGTENIEEIPQNIEMIIIKFINFASKMEIIPDTPE